MKLFLLMTFFLFACLLGFGQEVKLNAYIQSVLPGTVPSRIINEDGSRHQAAESKNERYYVYLLYTRKAKVTPVEMWLNGKLFSVITQDVEKTPVQLANNNPAAGKTTLIQQTKDKVIQLKPSTYTEVKSTRAAKKEAKTNEVVVVYKLNGKFNTITLRRFMRLAPVANE